MDHFISQLTANFEIFFQFASIWHIWTNSVIRQKLLMNIFRSFTVAESQCHVATVRQQLSCHNNKHWL